MRKHTHTIDVDIKCIWRGLSNTKLQSHTTFWHAATSHWLETISLLSWQHWKCCQFRLQLTWRLTYFKWNKKTNFLKFYLSIGIIFYWVWFWSNIFRIRAIRDHKIDDTIVYSDHKHENRRHFRRNSWISPNTLKIATDEIFRRLEASISFCSRIWRLTSFLFVSLFMTAFLSAFFTVVIFVMMVFILAMFSCTTTRKYRYFIELCQ